MSRDQLFLRSSLEKLKRDSPLLPSEMHPKALLSLSPSTLALVEKAPGGRAGLLPLNQKFGH